LALPLFGFGNAILFIAACAVFYWAISPFDTQNMPPARPDDLLGKISQPTPFKRNFGQAVYEF
jgi:hypothetical protein